MHVPVGSIDITPPPPCPTAKEVVHVNAMGKDGKMKQMHMPKALYVAILNGLADAEERRKRRNGFILNALCLLGLAAAVALGFWKAVQP